MHICIRRFPIFQAEAPNRYEKGSKLAGVIYVHRISDKRFTGISGRNFSMFRKLCGDETLKNVVLVTNMWDEVTPEVGKEREKQLSGNFFKPVLDLGAQMVPHHDTIESAYDIIRKILDNHPLVLKIQEQIVDEKKDIIDTDAGEAANKELNDQMKINRNKLKEVQEEMEQAMKDKDEQTRRELEQERLKLQTQMDDIKKNSDKLASGLAEERKEWETKVKDMERKAKEEGERVAAEHKRQLDDLTRQLRDAAAASEADRERLEEEMKKLRARSGIPIYK